MVLGSVLLQPQRLERAAQIPAEDAILGDIIALSVRLIIDASGEGRVLAAMGESMTGTFERMTTNAGTGLDSAVTHFETLFAGLVAPLQSAADTPPGTLGSVIDGVENSVTHVSEMLKQLNANQLRDWMTSVFSILEDDLHITPTFIHDVVLGFFDDMVIALQTAPENETPPERENRRAVAALIGRIKRYLDAQWVFPAINADAAATALFSLRQQPDVDEVLDRLTCTTEAVAAYLRAGEAIVDMLPYSAFPVFGEGGMGAAAAPPPREFYSFYASNLLENDNYDGDLGELPLPEDEIMVEGRIAPSLRDAFKPCSVILANSAFLYTVDTTADNPKWRVVDRKKYAIRKVASTLAVYLVTKVDVNDFLGANQTGVSEVARILRKAGVLPNNDAPTIVHEEGSNTWVINTSSDSFVGTRFGGDITFVPATAASALFQLPLTLQLPIMLQPTSAGELASELREAFENQGIPLSPRAHLSVVEADTEWLVDDGEFEYNIEKDAGKFKVSTGGFISWGWVRANLTPLNGDSVWVNKEATQVLLGQRIMHVGTDVSWDDAPVFQPTSSRRYSLKNSADTLEDWAWYTSWIKDALAIVVDGIKIGQSIAEDKVQYSIASNSLDAGRQLSELIVKLARHKPMKDLIGSPFLYDLLLDIGLAGVGGIEALVSPEEPETPEEATASDFSKVVDKILGAFFGVEIVDTHWVELIYEFILSTLTLVNHIEPQNASQSRPENFKESGGFVDLFWHVGLMVYTALIPDEDYALPFQTELLTGAYWLGGATGIGLVMSFVGLLVGQSAIAGANIGTDGWHVVKTMGKAAGKSLLYFWGYLKLFKGKV